LHGKSKHHRHYPSGGALFPIETYVIAGALREREELRGVFHYHPTDHALERLLTVQTPFPIDPYVRLEPDLHPASLIVFTSVWDRSEVKYGSFAYNLALFEVGLMSQNILLMTTAIGLRARPILGFNDGPIAELLDLDTAYEQPVLAIVLGHEKHYEQ
jgi:SagB-type dehydrogenase family enzyme